MFMVGFTAGYFMFKQSLTIEKPGEEGKNERIMNGYVKIFAWTAAILGIFSIIISGSAIAGLATVLTLVLGYFVGIIIYGMIHTHMTV